MSVRVCWSLVCFRNMYVYDFDFVRCYIVAFEIMAIITNVHTLFGHDIRIVDHCYRHITFCIDAVS